MQYCIFSGLFLRLPGPPLDPLPRSSMSGTEDPSAPGWAQPLSLQKRAQKRSQNKKQALCVQRVGKWNSVSSWETPVLRSQPLCLPRAHGLLTRGNHWHVYHLVGVSEDQESSHSSPVFSLRLQSKDVLWGCSGEGSSLTHVVVASSI